jgi:hypothetical protein
VAASMRRWLSAGRQARDRRVPESRSTDALPPAVRDRTGKLGFPTPEDLWLAGPFGDFLVARAREGVEMFESSFGLFIDVSEIQARLGARRLKGTPVWMLASLGEWGRRF